MTDESKPLTRDELTAKLKVNPRFREVESFGRGFTVAAAQPPKEPKPEADQPPKLTAEEARPDLKVRP